MTESTNTRKRYDQLIRRFPNTVIVLAVDEWDRNKLRTYDESADALRWVNGASYYRNRYGETGLFIDRMDLKERYDLGEIVHNAWKVVR